MNKQRNLDGTADSIVSKRYTSKKKPKKIIRTRKTKPMTYVGIDLHKEFLQVETMDDKGHTLFNEKITNTREDIKKVFSAIPKNSKCVMESSSVWYGVFRFLRDELGFDVILSNPYHTKAIAAAKKKTDKIDAHILADLLRGGYISSCHVPEKDTVQTRQLVRYRTKLVRNRTRMKNLIHSITLQNAIKIPGTAFSDSYVHKLLGLDDYRIDGYLKMIISINDRIAESDMRIKDALKHGSNAQLLESIPGVGRFTALTISSEIDNIERFSDSHKLCSYAGIVPSVRNSADTIRHGSITRRGSSMLRWVLVEAVHSHVRYAKNSTITNFYKRLAKKRGTSKAAVAAASKLLRIIYWMLKNNMTFYQCIKNA